MQQIVEQTKRVLAVTALACIPVFVSGAPGKPGATGSQAAAAFKAKCASCHGANGSGQTTAGKAMKLRDLRSPDVQGQSDETLLAIIEKGKGKMPGYEQGLGVDTCKALVTHIRRLATK